MVWDRWAWPRMQVLLVRSTVSVRPAGFSEIRWQCGFGYPWGRRSEAVDAEGLENICGDQKKGWPTRSDRRPSKSWVNHNIIQLLCSLWRDLTSFTDKIKSVLLWLLLQGISFIFFPIYILMISYDTVDRLNLWLCFHVQCSGCTVDTF